MKGDFTRFTYRPEKRYRGVLMQQGRVQLDSDWNEEFDIERHLDDTTRLDVIGACGVPKEGGGFEIGITADGSDLTISAGRLYVDGILCELGATPAPVTVTDPATLTLSVWALDEEEPERHQWLEVFDLAASGQAPSMVRITDTDPDALTVTIVPDLGAAAFTEPAVRRVVTYTTQDDLPNPEYVTPGDDQTPPVFDLEHGTYLAYADVWDRHVTALDDPGLLEPALGGPDTTTRIKTIRQVRLRALDDEALDRCEDVPDWSALLDGSDPGDRLASTGRLSARATPVESADSVCIIPPGAGYRRLENQLYRVEVHKAGALGTATFTWSRDNGSVAALWTGQPGNTGNAIEVSTVGRDAELGFASGQFVELDDDTRELQGLPGTLIQLTAPPAGHTLTLDPNVAVRRSDFPGNPKVSRWDSPGDVSVEIPATNDGWISLEDGVEVHFEAGHYNTGDYWLIPARTATADVEWPRDTKGRPIPAAPEGIRHHYCRLALVTVGGGVPAAITDCRDLFPPLTGICADDVCFDNSECQLPGAQTVQDALDALCDESTLRRHKKHLHGWGIVCGLQVVCGPDAGGQPRTHVTVREGYAIDCDGNDLLIPKDIPPVDVFQLIDQIETGEEGAPSVLNDGEGDVCLVLESDMERGPQFAVEPYDPSQDSTKALLAGTLLMDVYNDCIKNIEDFLRKELTVKEDGSEATGAYQREAILAGLVAQVVDPQSGQTIYLSRREHAIIQDFYTRLRDLLQSETFCAMFDDARPFPDYPKSLPKDMDTIFGRGHHVRVRLRPNAKKAPAVEAYTVGAGVNPFRPSTVINRYDLKRKILAERIDPIAGAVTTSDTSTDPGSGPVADVAFSSDGSSIYMIAPTRNGENTFFRAGTIQATGISWGPLVTICDLHLVTLATTLADKDNVYAVALGGGLYRINPDNVDPNMATTPLIGPDTADHPLHSVGHLVMTSDGRAFATSSSTGSTAVYDQVVAYNVVQIGAVPSTITLAQTGRDDIAVFEKSQGATTEALFVVGDGSGTKSVDGYRVDTGTRLNVSVPVPNTVTRLGVYPHTGVLLVGSEDSNALRLIDLRTNKLASTSYIPVQVAPIWIASDPASSGAGAYVLNYISNTITVLPDGVLTAKKFPLTELADYRAHIIEALVDLLAGFLQYLKDCLCDHFLVNCPECTGEEKIYLACISIRKNEVYKVCNFSRRKYVKSFPTVGYWLSLVPIMPFLDKLVEQFCCMVLPDLFSRYQVQRQEPAVAVETAPSYRYQAVRQGVATTQTLDVATRAREFRGKTNVASGVAMTSLLRGATARAFQPATALGNVVGQPVDRAASILADRGIDVQQAPHDPGVTPNLLANLVSFFRSPQPGDQVTLHEEAGRVRYYSVGAPAPLGAPAEAPAPPEEMATRLAAMEAELQELREFRDQVTEFMQSRRRTPRDKA